MEELSNDELRMFVEEAKIRHVLYSYCRAVDRCDEALLRSIYHEDAIEDHGTYRGSIDGFIKFAMELMRRNGFSVHQITNVMIDIVGDVAICESSFINISLSDQNGIGEPFDRLMTGRYLDRLERRDGAWKISRRQAVFDTNQLLPASGQWEGPLYGSFRPLGRKDRNDPFYTFCDTYGADRSTGAGTD